MSASRNDRGPLESYEVTWMSGRVETIQAHGVSWSNISSEFLPQFIRFYGEIDGRWVLVLQARESDIKVIRNVTSGEVLS